LTVNQEHAINGFIKFLKELIVKMQDYSLNFRLAAFVVLVVFTVVSCYIPTSPEAASPGATKNAPQPPSYPANVDPVPAAPSKQVSFYLTDGYEPSTTDTGKTAFALDGPNAPKNFMVISEEAGDGTGDTVVRFLDGENGMSASMYFSGKAAFPGGPEFPDGFILTQENEDTLVGKFSLYNPETETFSLTLEYEGEKETFELVLNKNIFSVYEKDGGLTPGQNTRVQNYITALGVWTAITLQLEAETPDGINMSRSVTGGPQYFIESLLKGIGKAVAKIRKMGAAVVSVATAVFGATYKVVAVAAAVIGVTISAPAVTAIAVAVAVVATVVTVAAILSKDDGKYWSEESEEDAPSAPVLPLEKRQAPRFKVYYRDASGEHLIPVMREGQNPAITQEFYIPPHSSSKYTAVAGVKFYYEVTLLESINDTIKTKYLFSADDTPYRPAETGEENGINYFEVKKRNGTGDDSRTVLTVKVYNGSKTSAEEDGKKDGNLVYFPCYYVNGQEFSEGEGFVINFIDEPSDAEKKQVLIPGSFVSDSVSYSVIPAVNKNLLPNDSVWYRGYFDKRPASLAPLMAY
jgi:hypothetical protein